MDRETDHVDLPAGIASLPAVFREVAHRANRAGMDGYEVADVEFGIEPESVRDLSPNSEPSSSVRIIYKKGRVFAQVASWIEGNMIDDTWWRAWVAMAFGLACALDGSPVGAGICAFASGLIAVYGRIAHQDRAS